MRLEQMIAGLLSAGLIAGAGVAVAEQADGGTPDTAAERTAKAAREARDKASDAADTAQGALKSGVDKAGEAGKQAAHDFDAAAHRAAENLRAEAKKNKLLHPGGADGGPHQGHPADAGTR